MAKRVMWRLFLYLLVVNACRMTLAEQAPSNLPFPIEMKIDRYYYPPDITQATIRLIIQTQSAMICDIEVRSDKEKIAQQHISLVKAQQQYDTLFDISAWPTGRFIVSAQVTDESGKNPASDCQVIYRQLTKPSSMPTPPSKPVTGSEGAFILDDKPFFPFFVTLLAQTPPTEIELKCFNVKPAEKDDLNKMVVENALERPMVPLPGKMTRNGDNVFFVLPEEKIMDAKAREFIENQKGNTSILCRLISYEARIPLYRGENPEKLNAVENAAEYRRIHHVIKKSDPDHLTSIHINYGEVSHLREYEDVADVIELADGRLPGSSYAQQLIPNLAAFVQEIRGLIGPNKLFLFWIGSSIPDARYRTAEELRCAAYLAMMHGASGLVFHMGHGGVDPSYTRQWSVYSGLAAEMEQLYPIVRSKVDKPDFQIKLPDGIDVMLRFPYMIAVNTTAKKIDAAFTVGDCEVLEMPFENRQLIGDNSIFHDKFTAYEPHVYLIKN